MLHLREAFAHAALRDARSCHQAVDLTAAIDSPRVSGHVQELHRQMLPYAREAPVLAFEQRMRDALG
ncbi:hypothetical protein [Streptomyces sp. ISL-96]|uniref:hypothetical protein n=1 Tax=Streptomyces sp. ISL-96 TaxID=2819191 RepID=UPI00203511C5|nr:hypothetical protein [Streptomyces sp. ISL-96]